MDEDEVKVEGGMAVLTGTVDSEREREAAAENAWEGGARTVVNNLEVVWDPEE